MKFLSGSYQLLSSAMADFRRDKIRTALTSLGIMIGVLSVVLLIALGLGLKNYIEGQFESLGANLLMVMPGSGLGGGSGFGPGVMGGVNFDEKDVRTLSRISGLKYLTPVAFKSAMVEGNGKEESGYVMGANEQFFGLMNLQMEVGEAWGKTEVGNRSKVVVIGNSLAESIFDKPADAMGKTISVSGIRLKIIGVAEKTGDGEQDNALFMPYTTTFGSINPDKQFFFIYMGVESKDAVETVAKEAEEALLKRYKDEDFSVTQMSEILSTINQIFGVINAFLLAIGSISLIVGGIGIMNIMYATVTERTREVGIRRAIGATRKDILLQFLTESVLLSIFGGIIGLLLSAAIVAVVRIWFPVALNLMAVLIAFGVSSAIGIFFGVFPARKAADLSPIEAIRYE